MKRAFSTRDQVKVVDLMGIKEGEYQDDLYDADAAAMWEADDFDEYEEFEEWAKRQREERTRKFRIRE